MKKVNMFIFDCGLCFIQILTHIFLGFFLRSFGHLAGLPQNMEKLGRGSLLIANHQNFLDPFIVLANIPFAIFLKIIPVRFPTSSKIINWKFVAKFLRIFGCYDIGNNSREKMLGFLHTRSLLQQGKTIFLFPEGKLSSTDEIGQLCKGVSFFVNDAKSVLFIRLQGFGKFRWSSFLRRRAILKFGEVKVFCEENNLVTVAELKEILNDIQ